MQAVQPIINFTQLVIIEPMVSAKGSSHLRVLRDEFLTKSLQKTDAWPTLEAARQAAAKTKWHPNVVDIFVVGPQIFWWRRQYNVKILEAWNLLESRNQRLYSMLFP